MRPIPLGYLKTTQRGESSIDHLPAEYELELRSWRKNRGSEDRKIGTAHDRPITRDQNDRK